MPIFLTYQARDDAEEVIHIFNIIALSVSQVILAQAFYRFSGKGKFGQSLAQLFCFLLLASQCLDFSPISSKQRDSHEMGLMFSNLNTILFLYLSITVYLAVVVKQWHEK